VKSGAYPNHTFVKAGTKSIAHYLQDVGYRVALSGKRHIAPASCFPFEYSGKKNPDLDAIDTLFGDCAKSSTPFALFACSNEPHSPWDKGDASKYPPADVKLPPVLFDTEPTRDEFSRYLAEVTYFDWQVGQIMKLLEKHGLAENTLLVVLSEQGNSFPFAKWTCYDAGLQSGMIARWPGRINAGSQTGAMVEYVDLVPTLLAAAGVVAPDILDGKSFLPVLRGESDEHKQYAYGLQTTRGVINGSEHYGIRSVRSEQFRYIRNLSPEVEFQNIVFRSESFKSWQAAAARGDHRAAALVHRYSNRPAVELYDCVNDPWNEQNLAQQPEHKQVLHTLSAKLDAWMAQQGDLGQATELAAKERQNYGRSTQKKNR
jgi:N-sulfoglucosamine sulfohydrolase